MTDYTLGSGGGGAPEAGKRYRSPSPDLIEIALQWMEKFTDLKMDQWKEIEKNVPSVPLTEIHGLLMERCIVTHPKLVAFGYFASALYAKCPEQVIACDLGLPYTGLGHRLDKVFVFEGQTPYGVGGQATGIAINRGRSHSFGYKGTGVIMNLGTTDHRNCEPGGVMIDTQDPPDHFLGSTLGIFKPGNSWGFIELPSLEGWDAIQRDHPKRVPQTVNEFRECAHALRDQGRRIGMDGGIKILNRVERIRIESDMLPAAFASYVDSVIDDASHPERLVGRRDEIRTRMLELLSGK